MDRLTVRITLVVNYNNLRSFRFSYKKSSTLSGTVAVLTTSSSILEIFIYRYLYICVCFNKRMLSILIISRQVVLRNEGNTSTQTAYARVFHLLNVLVVYVKIVSFTFVLYKASKVSRAYRLPQSCCIHKYSEGIRQAVHWDCCEMWLNNERSFSTESRWICKTQTAHRFAYTANVIFLQLQTF